jgi:hypothetical protein
MSVLRPLTGITRQDMSGVPELAELILTAAGSEMNGMPALAQNGLSKECPRRVRFNSTNRHPSPRLSLPIAIVAIPLR